MVDEMDDGDRSFAGPFLAFSGVLVVDGFWITHAFPFLVLMRSATSRFRARLGSKF